MNEKEKKLIDTLSAMPLERSFQLKRNTVDEENRTVELSFSSEKPYLRWFGYEILDHDEKSIDLERMRANAPLLVDHNRSDQIGVVESVVISSERKGRALVRFGKSQRANEIFQDVIDGIRTSVSVGYSIDEMTLESKDGEHEVYRVTRWTPYEISLVSIPADTSVGTNRQLEIKSEINEVTDMGDKTQTAPEKEQIDLDSVRLQERKSYQKEVNEMLSIGKRFNALDLAEKMIHEGRGVDELRTAILESRANDKVVKAESPEVGLNDKEVRSYSIVKLLNALANPDNKRAQEAAAFEFEVSSAATEKLHRDAKGAVVPYEILKRDLNVGTAIDGGNLVANDLLAGSFIESLENALALRQCGATMLTGLSGNVAIPRQTGGASSFWVAENGNPSESSATFDQVAMTPKTVGAYTEISRKLLLQSSISMEAFTQNELALRIALAIDLAGIAGTGTGNQPRGILNYSGVGNVALGTNGGQPTWESVVDLETAVGDANAVVQNMCYLINARGRGKFKKTKKDAGSGIFLMEGTEINGYRAVVSNQVPKNLTKGSGVNLSAAIFGNFADLIIGMWGGLDLQVNPYSLDTTGAVRVTAFQDVDIELRHPESFAHIKDMITT